MKALRVPPMYKCYGLVDADLLSNGTRHPNLALLKIAGFLYDNGVLFELILDENADLSRYEEIFMSRVFSFTQEPAFYTNAPEHVKQKFHKGGTGYYVTIKQISVFRERREKDMTQLENDPCLLKFRNHRGGNNSYGINMERQMPYYHLYDKYVEKQVKAGAKKDKYKDYLNYSIGFLTRKCYRHCPFCVNKLEKKVERYSKLEWFYDNTRPHVYFWDDNFLAADYTIWKPALQYLIDNRISFQFRQGLDERQLAENEHGEEMAEMLSRCKYHGDYIFAFDNWKDKPIIERALKIWKHYNPKKSTKFYLFCGYNQSMANFNLFYRDIWELFQRIKVLMQYDCVGYVMRHEDYHNAPIAGFYVEIARWCNQQQFYKKMSFWEFCYRNQTYWEENNGFEVNHKIKQFNDFQRDYDGGYYEREDRRGKVRKLNKCVKIILEMLEMFPEQREELIEMFNYKMSNLKNPSLWEQKNK